jgi:hypothetical protein
MDALARGGWLGLLRRSGGWTLVVVGQGLEGSGGGGGAERSRLLEDCEVGRPWWLESLVWCSDRFVAGMRPPNTPQQVRNLEIALRAGQSPYIPLKRSRIGWQVYRRARSWAAARWTGERTG